ncbi:MAG: leucine--tRNA ligase [Candidatus Aminicenantaceae bacterium]
MKYVYAFPQIEKKWQRVWDEQETFKAGGDDGKTKCYCLEMYPYPSGRIHMGHVRNFSIVDVISRFKFMQGFDVLHPIGWDAFGMPAENAAIEQGIHPRDWTLSNIEHMKAQLKKMGFSYDWGREITTCLPEYYTWNQWIFLKLLERGLAYRKRSQVNWCPSCQTVLANEQVVNSGCWRCDTQVSMKHMEQWFLKITDYAEELLSGLDQLRKWPEHVLVMQRNWIGRSTGSRVTFSLKDGQGDIDVFTTRLDTIYGATFMVLSPEHPLTDRLVEDAGDRRKLQGWIEQSRVQLRQMAEDGETEKDGIDTHKTALNPLSGEEIPVWVANYVLMEYGTGAIMAVPAHDERDYDFACKYGLPIREVIVPGPGEAPEEGIFSDYGKVVNSGPFSEMSSQEAMDKMADLAQEKGFGHKQVQYRLRDWGISRQRYWGTPIPVIYCEACGVVGIPYADLPVTLPEEIDFSGEEGSPLESIRSFVEAPCPQCGGPGRRETDTMDTFFDSSWYYFRYCSPQADRLPFEPAQAQDWLPVDVYVGGVEHAILHLIYARFFCKLLRDLGLTDIDEPFPFYLSQGMVTKDGAKMSKSKGNVVDPDEMITKYGADATRLFMLFASPPEKEFAWDEKGIEGTSRFLHRIWKFYHEFADILKADGPEAELADCEAPPAPLRVKLHQTVRKVTLDIDKRYHLNTAVSSIMELFNRIKRDAPALIATQEGKALTREAFGIMLQLLAPFAPYITEELWEKSGHTTVIARSSWPKCDSELTQEESVTVVVQVNGKVRAKFEAERDLPEEEVKRAALELERIQSLIAGQELRKIICIPNKLVNIVV